jgi:hypothetical protein
VCVGGGMNRTGSGSYQMAGFRNSCVNFQVMRLVVSYDVTSSILCSKKIKFDTGS